MAVTDALALPRYAQPYELTVVIWKTDGTLITDWTGVTATVSKDRGNYAAATNTPTQVQTSGTGYLLLTATEMTCNSLTIKITVSALGSTPFVFTLYPAQDTMIRVNVIDWASAAVNALISGKVDSVNSVVSGTASAGTTNSITLAGASAVDQTYKYSLVRILAGTGAGQARLILDYVGSTKVATVNKPWATNPDNTSVFAVVPWASVDIVHAGIAQAGAASTITLAATASATNDTYKGQIIFITGGTGIFQTRVILSYNGTTKVATVSEAWATNPANDSVYQVMAQGRTLVDSIKAAVIDAAQFVSHALDTLVWNDPATRILTAFGFSVTVGTNNDKAGYSLTAGEHTLIAADVQAGLSAQGYTLARAILMDKMNVTGNLASSNEVTAIQNNTRVNRTVPAVIERPDSGSDTYVIKLAIYDEIGNMEAPDAAPTLHVANQSGTSRDSRLDNTTMQLVSPGRYETVYTNDSGDALEQLLWTFSVTEGGATRSYDNTSLIVDTSAVDFTSADRVMLQALNDMRPSGSNKFVVTSDPDGGLDASTVLGAFPVGAYANIPLVDISGLLTAAGFATAITALEAYGNTHWATATGFSTFNPAVDSVKVGDLLAAALAKLFTTNTGATFGDAVNGSVVKEIATHASAFTVQDLVNGVLDELLAGHTDTLTVGAALNLIQAISGQLSAIGGTTMFVRNPVKSNGDTEIVIARSFVGSHRLHYTTDSLADLQAAGITLKLEWDDRKVARSFPADLITGSAGAWDIYIPITSAQSRILIPGTFFGEIAVYEDDDEIDSFGIFNVYVIPNP